MPPGISGHHCAGKGAVRNRAAAEGIQVPAHGGAPVRHIAAGGGDLGNVVEPGGLQLPGEAPLTGAGEGQRLACLEALALHGL